MIDLGYLNITHRYIIQYTTHSNFSSPLMQLLNNQSPCLLSCLPKNSM